MSGTCFSAPKSGTEVRAGEVFLVSACLAGLPTRYDGTDACDEELMRQLAGRFWLPVCPEELGGLPTPRPPADMVGGDGFDVLRRRARVIAADGRDVTAAFLEGAHRVLEVARRFRAQVCYLKGRSPSCGLTPTWEEGQKIRGIGVCAALLVESGLKVVEVG